MTWGIEDRRKYQREYAQRRRDARLNARRMSCTTCPRKFGKFGVCGAVLDSYIDAQGRTRVSCESCERFRQGICRDCPLSVAGAPRKARRCAVHTEAAKQAAFRKYAENHRKEINRHARNSYRNNKMVRRARNEYKRVWRKANPDKVRKQKRREGLRQNPNRLAYHTAYREARRIERAELERLRLPNALAPRSCLVPDCATLVSGRRKKCEPCKQREIAAALAELSARRIELRRAA